MKTVHADVLTATNQSSSIKVLPKLTAEWNMNRYFDVTADNTPSDNTNAYDAELFPVESIVIPNRPGKGINKARVGSSMVAGPYAAGVRPPRFYVASVDDEYKYWTSPAPSDASTAAITNVSPAIIYTSNVTINKIVIQVENTWASPNAFTIETTTDGTSWSVVRTQAQVSGWEASGRIVLYWDGLDWTQTKPAVQTPTRTLRGIRMVVTSMKAGYTEDGVTTKYKQANSSGGYDTITTDGKNSFFDLIEISGRREADLTSYLVSTSDTFDMAEVSEVYPIGTLTTNTADISLWNEAGIFSANNASTPYAGLLEPNAEINLDYIYHVNGAQRAVHQLTMYSGVWGNQSGTTINLSLEDHSKFFQTTYPPKVMWENLSVYEIIWRLCDSIGFSNYTIDKRDDLSTDFIVPVFWTTGDETMWEVLNELAKATQTAIYFNSDNKLQVKTRNHALNDAASSSFTLLGQAAGSNLANIVLDGLEQDTVFEANSVKVVYQKTNWSDMNNFQPTMQRVWEPDGTVTLRSDELVRSMTTSGTHIYISDKSVSSWPWAGIVNIDGELIRYEGKEFTYYTGGTGTTANTVNPKSAEEKDKFNLLTDEFYRNKNTFTGGLKIVERGLWNSEAKAHDVDVKADGVAYSVRHHINGTRRTGVAGMSHIKAESKVQLASGSKTKKTTDLLLMTRGAEVDTPYYYYGTKFKFAKSDRPHQRAGIVIHNNGTGEDGYYIEFTPTKKLGAKERKQRNELVVYTRTGGKYKQLGGKGAKVAIAEGIEYEVDVTYRTSGSDHKIGVWVNGKRQINLTISGSNRNAANGKFGVFVNGKTKAQFEYLYAVRRQEDDLPDDFSFLDKVDRAYTGNQWELEWVYQTKTKTRRVRKKTVKTQYKFNEMYFDDFGPFVHEVREFDVNFDPSPVLHSRPYSTNDWGAAVLEYRANPYGATFVIANTSRKNAVLNGDDNLTFPKKTVNQVLTVLGRALVIDEAEEVIAEDSLSVKKRGTIESEISSPWIQSEPMAKEISEWVRKNMSYGNDSLRINIFGNPLLEIGDVVTLNYPAKNYSNVKYFVTSTATSFDTGLSTTLGLRKVPA